MHQLQDDIIELKDICDMWTNLAKKGLGMLAVDDENAEFYRVMINHPTNDKLSLIINVDDETVYNLMSDNILKVEEQYIKCLLTIAKKLDIDIADGIEYEDGDAEKLHEIFGYADSITALHDVMTRYLTIVDIRDQSTPAVTMDLILSDDISKCMSGKKSIDVESAVHRAMNTIELTSLAKLTRKIESELKQMLSTYTTKYTISNSKDDDEQSK